MQDEGTILVIVPCGQSKIWDRDSEYGAVEAKDAYTGIPFRLHRQFAEKFGNDWVILSAKYGFIEPSFVLPGPYNVTFKRKKSQPISVEELCQQVEEKNLDSFKTIIGLGGKEYRKAIEEAFLGKEVELSFPFAGLPIGKTLKAVKQSLLKDVWSA